MQRYMQHVDLYLTVVYGPQMIRCLNIYRPNSLQLSLLMKAPDKRPCPGYGPWVACEKPCTAPLAIPCFVFFFTSHFSTHCWAHTACHSCYALVMFGGRKQPFLPSVDSLVRVRVVYKPLATVHGHRRWLMACLSSEGRLCILIGCQRQTFLLGDCGPSREGDRNPHTEAPSVQQ